MSHSQTRRLALLTVAILGAAISSIPFVYMLGTAVKPHAFVLEPTFWPTEPTLENFGRAIGQAGFGRAFANSLIVASAATILSVGLSSMIAFAIARFSFPGRNALYYGLLLLLTVPALVLIIPQFVLAKNLGLLNSLHGLILVYAASAIAFNVFLLRGFFEEIPADLFEAAQIDGASVWQQYRYLGLPLARPALATVVIFTFLGAWDEFTWAVTSLNDANLYTLPVALRFFQRAHGTEWGLVFAAATIAVVPVVLVFLAFQRHFVAGLALGGSKG